MSKTWSYISAFLFSLFIVIGITFDKYGSILKFKWYYIFILIILTIIFKILIDKLSNFIVHTKFKTTYSNKFLSFILDKHPFISIFIATLLGSFLYLIFFYPGTVSFDGCWQLNSYFKFWTFNDHHPALLSIIMGNLYKIGGYGNLGVFLYIVPQVFINSLVYGYTLRVMNEIKTPRFLKLIAFIFYSIFPFSIINSITYIKDTIYYLMFLFLIGYLFRNLRFKKEYKVIHSFTIFGVMLILMLWRNTGFYLDLIIALTIILSNLKNKKIVISSSIILISILGVNYMYQNVFLTTMNIKPALVREKLSIPLQQTGRYLHYYKDELTTKEIDNLNVLFNDNIFKAGEVYNPNRSDEVKELIKDYPTHEELILYFKTWFRMGLKHPLTYIDATLNNTYAYFYSKNKSFINEELGFYTITNYNLNLGYNENTKLGRTILEDIAAFICKTPVLDLLYSPYFYTWLLIFCTFIILSIKKYYILIYFIPLYFTLAMCIISPVNGHIRYMEPIIFSIIFMFSILLYEINYSKKN